MTTPAGVWVATGGQWLRGTQTPVPPASGSRFFGDPGVGKVLTGAPPYTAVSTVSDGVAWLDQATGVKHLLTRHYTNDLWSRSAIVADHNAGRVPFPSFKLNATPSNAATIIGGSRDLDLAAEAQWAAKQAYPIFSSFYHEMETPWTSNADAANWRSIFRRIVGIFRDNGATNVSWMPIFVAPWDMTASAENGHGRWYKWDPDWKGTESGANGRATSTDWYTGTDAVCDLHGYDQYNPEVNTTAYRDLSTQFDPMFTKIAGDGRTLLPWMIPEMGTTLVTNTTLPMPSDGWTGYYQRAFQYMRDNAGVGFVSFNCFQKYNFINGDDHVARLAGYKAALVSESSYVVSTRPA